FLALSPKAAPVVPARLCLRSGFTCFNQIARAMGFEVPEEADPDGRISLSYEEFLVAVARMREVDFPIEREPADAWAHFVGWRINYEQAAYAVAAARDAVPAPWAGPARPGGPPLAPAPPPLRAPRGVGGGSPPPGAPPPPPPPPRHLADRPREPHRCSGRRRGR